MSSESSSESTGTAPPGAGFAAIPGMLEDLARRLAAGLPPLFGAARADLEMHFRRVLQAQLVRLDLCSRGEFETQARVLAHTRQRLAELEARVAVLERRAAGGDAPGPAGEPPSPSMPID